MVKGKHTKMAYTTSVPPMDYVKLFFVILKLSSRKSKVFSQIWWRNFSLCKISSGDISGLKFLGSNEHNVMCIYILYIPTFKMFEAGKYFFTLSMFYNCLMVEIV